jgi:hypothetical protein
MEKFYYVSDTHTLLEEECPYLKVKVGSKFCEEKCAHNHLKRSVRISSTLSYIECSYKDDHEHSEEMKKKGIVTENKVQPQDEFTFSDKQLCMLHERLTVHQPISFHPSYNRCDEVLQSVARALSKRGIKFGHEFDKDISRHVRLYLKDGKPLHYYYV